VTIGTEHDPYEINTVRNQQILLSLCCFLLDFTYFHNLVNSISLVLSPKVYQIFPSSSPAATSHTQANPSQHSTPSIHSTSHHITSHHQDRMQCMSPNKSFIQNSTSSYIPHPSLMCNKYHAGPPLTSYRVPGSGYFPHSSLVQSATHSSFRSSIHASYP